MNDECRNFNNNQSLTKKQTVIILIHLTYLDVISYFSNNLIHHLSFINHHYFKRLFLPSVQKFLALCVLPA
jgi:hypothetical protein